MTKKKCDLSTIERKYKMGDIHPVTGKIFGHYTGYHKSGEQWYTPETYEKRMSRLKKHRKTDKYKEYTKSYYEKHKDDISEKGAEYHKKRKQTSPLSFIYRNSLASIRERKKKGKNIDFTITKEFLRELWDLQKGKCYYTGIEMRISARDKHPQHPQHPSLDRKDSNEGYTKENVVFCCQSINFAKSCYSENEFKDFLKLIKETKND